MATPTDPDALLPREQTSQALKASGYPVEPSTLATKASRGGGPPYQMFGRRALYRWGDALAWAQSQLSAPRRNTSEGDAIDKATRSRSAPPSSALRGALRKTTSEEIDSAIEAAAMVFKAEPRISRDALYKRLFEGGTCTFNRFRTKIWQPARQKAGLPPHAPKGRRPKK